MKAMILAAGFGTRLRPLTDNKPKALIEVGGKPLLEWVILKLRNFGFNSIVINTHHYAEKIDAFLQTHNNFGIEIVISREEKILGTGGGIKRVQDFFAGESEFLVHNVDVLSTINLAELWKCHQNNKNLATLFVQARENKRGLYFNQDNLLKGRWQPEFKASPTRQRFAFNGIHVISKEIFQYFPETEVFSITDIYLNRAAAGSRIYGYHPENIYWRDLGRIPILESVNAEILPNQKLVNQLVAPQL